MRIAGILQTREYMDEFSTIQQLHALADCVIVLADRSFKYFEKPPEVTTLISVTSSRERWNCSTNQTMLHAEAKALDCPWIVRLDDDMVQTVFRTRAQLESEIERIAKEGHLGMLARMFDVWDGMESTRRDGIWGNKFFPLLYFNPLLCSGMIPIGRLHSIPHKHSDLTGIKDYSGSDAVYHFGCASPERRIRRFEKYSAEDPKNIDQYQYFLEEHEVSTAPIDPETLKFINQFIKNGNRT